MKKVLLLLLLSFCLFPATSFADFAEEDILAILTDSVPKKNVAVFIEIPMQYHDKAVPHQIVADKINDFLPPAKFNILPLDKSEQEMMYYKEDKGIVMNEYLTWRASREDLQTICKNLGEDVDYAFLAIITAGLPKSDGGLFTMTFSIAVTCDIRLFDVSTGRFIASSKVEKIGKSTRAVLYGGIPSYDHAYNEAIRKALKELKLDISNI